ncbi:hypothetical protein D3C75_1366810 [compost metagenome]
MNMVSLTFSFSPASPGWLAEAFVLLVGDGVELLTVFPPPQADRRTIEAAVRASRLKERL